MSTSCKFHYDDVTLTSLLDIKYGQERSCWDEQQQLLCSFVAFFRMSLMCHKQL